MDNVHIVHSGPLGPKPWTMIKVDNPKTASIRPNKCFQFPVGSYSESPKLDYKKIVSVKDCNLTNKTRWDSENHAQVVDRKYPGKPVLVKVPRVERGVTSGSVCV